MIYAQPRILCCTHTPHICPFFCVCVCVLLLMSVMCWYNVPGSWFFVSSLGKCNFQTDKSYNITAYTIIQAQKKYRASVFLRPFLLFRLLYFVFFCVLCFFYFCRTTDQLQYYCNFRARCHFISETKAYVHPNRKSKPKWEMHAEFRTKCNEKHSPVVGNRSNSTMWCPEYSVVFVEWIDFAILVMDPLAMLDRMPLASAKQKE